MSRDEAREWRSKNAERFTRIDAVTEFRDYSRYGGYDTDAMLDAYASEQVERIAQRFDQMAEGFITPSEAAAMIRAQALQTEKGGR